jgi:hypothetical protein
MSLRYIALIATCLLAACGGGGGMTASAPVGAASAAPSSSNPQQLVPTSFTVAFGGQASQAAHRAPQYVGAGSNSVTITLNSVNGGADPAGLTTSVTSTIVGSHCPCTVSGPLVPPGSDTFSFTTYDGANGTGNVIATYTNTYTVSPGVANTQTGVTLQGVPHAFAIAGVPSGAAGTAFAAPATLTLTVKDADGNTISGTYANAVTITDSDTSGALGSQIAINGGAYGSSVTSTASTDVLTLKYGGLAIATATLSASATGATSATAAFAPTRAAIVYSGPLNGTTPEIDLYAPTGTGASGTFTASEVGWTGATYGKALTATTSGCGSIGTVSPNSGTSFTFSVASTPLVGSCTITLSDGLGETQNITGTFTTNGFGLQ